MTDPDAAAGGGPTRRLGLGAAIVVVLVALGATVAVAIIRGAGAPSEAVPTPVVEVTAGAQADELYVHVSGAVRTPGLYLVARGARVVDGVAAADGFAEDADRDGVNLARPLVDGEHLLVPRIGEAPDVPAESAAATVNLNTADATLLETLPRIGPALATRIIEWRTANGPFTSVEDLLAVPGIGEKMLESLRALVTV